jgi:exodeoxyribonuclease V gamma subunit
MIVHASNRIEELVAILADLATTPAGDPSLAPLVPETIAVQGRGMERWLSLELSNRLGVWANPSFPFPRVLIETAFEALLGPSAGPAEGRSGFEPESLTWAIACLLPRLLTRSEFEPLARFLADDGDGVRRIQLAARVAETFDHYVSYRPEMIAAWEAGHVRGAGPDPAQEEWQATLWRELVAGTSGQHLAARAQAFLSRVREEDGPIAGFPARVSLFGITTLPPLWVDVLVALGERVELHLFLLHCARDPLAEPPIASPLWASLGSVGRDFQRILSERCRDAVSPPVDAVAALVDDVAAPGLEPPGPLLGALQQSVREGDSSPSRFELGDDDRSIQIHACHGPMREVEVLHDQLTELFEADPSLEPRDVVVMTPDIEAYAPFIEAVFDAPSASGRGVALGSSFGSLLDDRERPRIAYRLADRRLRQSYEVLDAFWLVLDVLAGRFTASALIDLLLVDRVRNRFEIETAELDVLLAWLRDAGIRWGVDARHRGEVGQPELGQNTWREGLDRLFLGLAMPAGAESLFAGTAPAPGVEPGDSVLLGRFAEFCEGLFELREKLADARSLDAWSQDLGQVLDRMIDRSEDGAQQQAWLRHALASLAQRAREAGFDEPVTLASVRQEVERHLERSGEALGFLDGGVTFCQLVPMRSIPFRVIALLGMNDDAFPRSRQPLGFDLVAASPRPGDRTARDDDRYLFLEALISAREHLLVTYVGQSVRDGGERAPSVVVDELLDEIGRLARLDARERLVVLHPLHSFSPRYFDGSNRRLVSYSGSDRDGAEALTKPTTRAGRPWVRSPLTVDATEQAQAPLAGGTKAPLAGEKREPLAGGTREIELRDLARFFEHPVREFLRRRFGLYLGDDVAELEDREPMELDALDNWKLRDSLLAWQVAGKDPDESRELLRAQGRLPPGALGDLASNLAARRAGQIASAVRVLQEGERLPVLPLDVELGGFRLVGEIDDLWPAGRVCFLHSQLPHRRELNFWIQHLALSLSVGVDVGARDVAVRSLLVAPSKVEGATVLELGPVPAARDHLLDLLNLYEQGQKTPLPLLPRTSRAHANACAKSGWQDESTAAAFSAWDQGRGVPTESSDPYLLQAFRDVDLFDPACELPGGLGFAGVARQVFEPYLLALREIE